MTADLLRRDLAALRVEPGDVLVVHSSLSAIGRVGGGAATVVSALLDAVGEQGTLAMPAATPELPETGFDLRSTPTTMGAIPEAFRKWPGTLRSDHPLESVCARGPAAAQIIGEHPLEFSEGPGTPFGKLHDLDAKILLLGVGFNRCTALHFAETIASRRRLTTVRLPRSGVWIEVRNVADDNDTHFPIVGEKFMETSEARRAKIGGADSVLCSMRELVAFAKAYFEQVL